MSKFHVGDKVRIEDKNGLLNLFGLIPNDVEGVWTVGEAPYPSDPEDYAYTGPKIYWIENERGQEWDIPEEVLRPADIFAFLNVEGLTGLPPEAFTDGPDPAPALTAIAQAVDNVNHPPHYKKYPVEVIEITEQLDFNRGNAVKYILRAGHKAGVDELEDLSKAAWYVNRAIEKLKKERSNG